MAVRNPTSYTTWIDEEALRTGFPILAAEPDNVINDQLFALDSQALIMTCAGLPLQSVAGALTKYSTFYVRNKDKCSVGYVTNDEIECDVYARVEGLLTTTGNVQLQSTAVGNNTSTIAVAAGGPVWVQGDTMNVKTNGIEDTIDVYLQKTGGSSSVSLSSILIIARRT